MSTATAVTAARKSTRLSADQLKKLQTELLAQRMTPASTMNLNKKAGTQVLYNGANATGQMDYVYGNGDRRFGPQPTANITQGVAEWFTLPNQACTLTELSFCYAYIKPNPTATDTVWFFLWDGTDSDEGWVDFGVPAQNIINGADEDHYYDMDVAAVLGEVSFAAEDKEFAFGYYCNDWQTWDIAFLTLVTPMPEGDVNFPTSLYGDMSNENENYAATEDAWVWNPFHYEEGATEEEDKIYIVSLETAATVTLGEGGGGGSSANLFTALLNETGDQLVSTTSYNFGNVNVGQSGNVAVYVANNGTATGTITAASLANTDGIFSVQGTIGDLAPNDYMDFAVTFRPTAAGQKTNTLVFTTATGTLNFSLTGTGVSEGPDAITNAKAANIAIYPNPAKEVLNISNAENAQISIYNLMGQEVRRVEKATALEVINVADLARGSYIVKIMNEGNVATQKFNVVR